MQVLRVNAVYGSKYVILAQGRVRECFFIGTTFDKKCNGTYPHLIVDAAGIGEVRIQLETHHFPENKEGLEEYETPMANTYNDFRNKNFITYNALDDGREIGVSELSKLLPNFSYDASKKAFVGYLWDAETLSAKKEEVNWEMWRLDAEGLATDIPQNYYYPSAEACEADHEEELRLVTF